VSLAPAIPLAICLTLPSRKGLTYKQVVSPYTKKVWLDRNLGAEKVAADGGYYKLEPAKKIGTCPFGFDMPSWKTLEAETTGAGVKNVDDAFNSFLAIPAAGFKNIVNKYRLTSQGSLVAMWVNDKEKNSLTILDNRVGGGDMTPKGQCENQYLRAVFSRLKTLLPSQGIMLHLILNATNTKSVRRIRIVNELQRRHVPSPYTIIKNGQTILLLILNPHSN
jgi:hypothetical protein